MNACGVNSSSITLTWSRWMPQLREILAVRTEILADGRHRDRIAAEQLEVVGDVARAAAELAAHARHQERHVEDVHLVRQDVVLELVLEHHDGVVGERTADQRRHRAVVFAMGNRQARRAAAGPGAAPLRRRSGNGWRRCGQRARTASGARRRSRRMSPKRVLAWAFRVSLAATPATRCCLANAPVRPPLRTLRPSALTDPRLRCSRGSAACFPTTCPSTWARPTP